MKRFKSKVGINKIQGAEMFKPNRSQKVITMRLHMMRGVRGVSVPLVGSVTSQLADIIYPEAVFLR